MLRGSRGIFLRDYSCLTRTGSFFIFLLSQAFPEAPSPLALQGLSAGFLSFIALIL